MGTVEPKLAPVRPRVTRLGDRDARLAEEVLAELADEMPRGVVTIEGARGSGRSTALAHLAATMEHDGRFVFLDEPEPEYVENHADNIVVAATRPNAKLPANVRLLLAGWGPDELIEYLLATKPEACASVMARLGAAARMAWRPLWATIVLDRFAANEAACDATAELVAYVREQSSALGAWSILCRFCLSLSTGQDLLDALDDFQQVECRELLTTIVLPNDVVYETLAAEALAADLRVVKTSSLRQRVSSSVVEFVAARCRDDEAARMTLSRTLESRKLDKCHPTAASIVFAMNKTWRPAARPARHWRRYCWNLERGYFAGAQWNELDLIGAKLWLADLSDARLDGACLSEAMAVDACFNNASLVGAKLVRAIAGGASFVGGMMRDAKLPFAKCQKALFKEADLTAAALMTADLRGADFTAACLVMADLTDAGLDGAVLEDADLSGAMLRGAHLVGCDLRSARFDGACLDNAWLKEAQLEDVEWPDARLSGAQLPGAHLTGSRLPRADLRNAMFSGAGLADIEWEDADLRGADLRKATFHMGSSRSGLVGSPLACEGSRTGFYTDDYEDMHFKRPDEIRKANLCGADLRGAKIDGLDFYLVDLRGAKLDAKQLEHVRRCGAILGNVLA